MSVGRVINGKLAVRDGRLACDCCGNINCDDAKIADPFNIGGCCFSDGSCLPLHQCDCERLGGSFKGRFVTCAMFPPCAQPPGGGPDPGPDPPDDPDVCVHFYEAQIQCIPDGSGGFTEEPGPVNRTRSSCEPCSATPQYPANGPGGIAGGNNGWVRETRADGSDYWVFKYCSEDSCSGHASCAGGGPHPSEFGVTFDMPEGASVDPGTISDYCANQTYIGAVEPPPYVPSIPQPPEPEGGEEEMMVMASSTVPFYGAASTGGAGCGACKDHAEEGLPL